MKKAFSLIELIFIISVLGIIAAVAVPKLLDSRSNAVVTTIKQDIVTITTSIQSHYMLNNGIDKIADAVNINSKTWLITDKKLEYKDNEATCIVIEVLNSKLEITIDEVSGEICKKLYDSGIRTVSYSLF
jgi:general secretion pathway protein G